MVRWMAAGLAMALGLTAAAAAEGGRLSLEAASNRPDLVSGGDVLVRARLPAGLAVRDAFISLNDGSPDVDLAPAPDGDGYLALVSGLKEGRNTLHLRTRRGSAAARLVVVNHPNGGPIFSGPQIQPWTCREGATNAKCDRPVSIAWQYMPQGGREFRPYDPARPAADVARTTTSEGLSVPYVVRVESFNQNRSGVSIATLYDPSKPWTAIAPQPQWNKGVHVLQGSGCGTGYADQPAPNPLNANALGKGFIVVTVALLHNTINCNPVVQAEAALMAKERVAETYGLFDLFFAQGSSGGAISQIADQNAYPGLYDGLILNHLFADSDASRIAAYDCRLVADALSQMAPVTDAQRGAIVGMLSGCASSPTRFQIYDPAIGTGCNVPDTQKFNQTSNPKGVRCTLQDYQVNQVGRRRDGYANGRLDNVGVQYGLKAVIAGTITPAQFVELNERIGGHDINFNRTQARTSADRAGLRRLYRSGIANTVSNLGDTPIIETRLSVTDFHQPFHAVMVRARLVEAQGHHDNYALWRSTAAQDPTFSGTAFDTMVAWIRAIKADRRDVPKAQKVKDSRPALARDRCTTGDGVDKPLSACPRPPELVRVLAGAPDTNFPGKCRLKRLNRGDYGGVSFTDAQWARLRQTFPDGVCDYTKPMVDYAKTTPWLAYDGDGRARTIGAPR